MDTVHLDITSLVSKAKKDVDTVVRRFIFGLASRVIMRSPVDTGRFRANWVIGFDGIERGPGDAGKDPGPVTQNGSGQSVAKSNAMSQLMDLGNSWVGQKIVYLTNGLPYAYYLEYGRMYKSGFGPGSQQAPYGMVRLTINEYAEILNQAKPFTLGF